MGWDYTHAKHYLSNGKVDRKAECDDMFTWTSNGKSVRVLKSAMRGRVYYAAVEVISPEGERNVVGTICLTAGMNRRDPYFNFGVKVMDESYHPFYYDCPKGILDLLTETQDADSLEWRRKCEEKRKAK